MNDKAKQQDNKPDNDPFDFDSLTGVHSEIQEQTSAPNVEAIAAHSEKQVAAAQANSDSGKAQSDSPRVDKSGTRFDPEKHAVSADGTPSITPAGNFRKKRRTKKSIIAKQSAELIALEEQKKRENNARAAASAAVDMSIQSLQLLLGPEWQPQLDNQIDERQQLKDATSAYFIAKDINDFPPGVALSVVVFAYAMPRLIGGEETKTRLGKAKIWFAEKFNKLKRKRKNAAQSDSRNDGKRENNASEKVVRVEQESGERHPRT